MSKKRPEPVPRFPMTPRITAFEAALEHELHLVRDNFHLWGIRKSDKAHVWLCSSTTYDGLWREAVMLFRSPNFDLNSLPYSVGETDKRVTLYDPKTGEERTLDKKDLRRRRGEYDK